MSYQMHAIRPLLIIIFCAIHLQANSGVWFCPDDKPANKIIHFIDNATKNIDAALYTFTHKPLALALKKAHDRGVQVSIIFDPDETKNPHSNMSDLKEYGIAVYAYQRKKDELMHHKYCIIDDDMVLNGSMNWTRRGSSRNQESMMWCDDTETIKRFKQQHKKLLQRSSTAKPKRQSWTSSIRKNITSLLRQFTG